MVLGSNEPEEEDIGIVHKGRPRNSSTVRFQDTGALPDSNIPAADSDADAFTGEEYLNVLNIIVPHAIVDSHNAEEGRISDVKSYKEEEVKRVLNRSEAYNKAKLKGSMREKWCNPKEIPNLKPSYVSL